MALALQLVTFLGFFAWYKLFTPEGAALGINAGAALLPLLILYTAALSLGVSLWLAALSAKYRDFIHLLQFVIQLWMFATPIIYPLSKVAPQWHWIVALNPMSFVVESFRWCLLGRGTIDLPLALLSASVTLVLFISGLLIFQKVQRTFVDTV
jgi:lipopolysaccharide transport system permease protein